MPQQAIKILVHPQCSKCQCAIGYEAAFHQLPIEYINYTITEIPEEIIDTLVDAIPFDILIRTNEMSFVSNYGNEDRSKTLAKQILRSQSILMQRPILIHQDNVIIGRPPTLIEDYLNTLCTE